MKIALSLIAIVLFIVTANAQSRTISKRKYEKAFEFAVSKTNDDYPVVLKVTTFFIENGKRVRKVTEVIESESLLRFRITRTTVAGGRTTKQYQVSVGFAKVFCSDDGVSWKSSEGECYPSVSSYGTHPRSLKRSVTVKWVKGKKFKVYREYSVLPEWEGNNPKIFRETVSTMDSRGFFRTVVNTEGTLRPREVTLIRKQSWITKARIKPIVQPIE